MGWDSVVSSITDAARSGLGFGSGVASGVKGGATSLIDGVVSLGSGALSAVKATGRAAIDPVFREQKMTEATELARRAADYGGRLYDDPATRRQAWDTVQSAVGSIKEQYVSARDAAAAKGQLSEFYGGLVGRGGFEVAGLLVPVTKLGALGKVGAAAEGAADLQKAAKVGEALTGTKAGVGVTECADVPGAMVAAGRGLEDRPQLSSIGSAATAGSSRASGADRITVTTYRVEGQPNQRILINEEGKVSLVPDKDSRIWLNFGQEDRATSYLQTKIAKGLPNAQIKSFQVDSSLLHQLRSDAVPERIGRLYPDRPLLSADPWPDQYGLPKTYFDQLMNSVIQGTGKIGL